MLLAEDAVGVGLPIGEQGLQLVQGRGRLGSPAPARGALDQAHDRRVGQRGEGGHLGRRGGLGDSPGRVDHRGGIVMGDPGLGQEGHLPAPDHPLGQAPEVLDQDQPEHRRDGPELADGQRSDRLEGQEEPGDPRLIQLAVGVGHQRQGQGVDAGIAPDLADGELGELRVVAAGQVLLDLAEDVLDDVEVVGQPVRVDPTPLGPVGLSDDPPVGLDEDLPVLGEPTEQEIARLEVRLHDPGRGQPAGQQLEPIQAVEFPPDRRLAPGVDEGGGGRVGSEGGRIIGGCERRTHPAGDLPGDAARIGRGTDGPVRGARGIL